MGPLSGLALHFFFNYFTPRIGLHYQFIFSHPFIFQKCIIPKKADSASGIQQNIQFWLFGFGYLHSNKTNFGPLHLSDLGITFFR